MYAVKRSTRGEGRGPAHARAPSEGSHFQAEHSLLPPAQRPASQPAAHHDDRVDPPATFRPRLVGNSSEPNFSALMSPLVDVDFRGDGRCTNFPPRFRPGLIKLRAEPRRLTAFGHGRDKMQYRLVMSRRPPLRI